MYINTQNPNGIDRAVMNVDSNNPNHSIGESKTHVDMQLLEISISNKVTCEVELAQATVEHRVNDAFLFAMDKLGIPELELAMRSVCVNSTLNPISSEVLDSDQRGFSAYTNGQQMITSSRYNSDTNLDGTHEPRGNFIAQASDLMVSGGNFG